MSSHEPSATTTLTVLTYNLWGIFNAKMRVERMKHFATKVETYDVILLQEQFDATDFELIKKELPAHVRDSRYFRRFPSGFYGSGCAVISKYPIRTALFHMYPLQGQPEMVLHGDYFANKGAALIKIDVPVEHNGAITTHEVNLYTTHLVAVYQMVSRMKSWKNERYLPHRISQAISLAEFVIATSKPTDRVIIGGDFNCSQRSLEVQTLLILLKRHGFSIGSALPTPNALLEKAVTRADMETARRTYTYSDENAYSDCESSYFKILDMQSDIPAQIDHLFYTQNDFSLKSFQDCPDTEKNYPFLFDNVNGSKSPGGVVVFTRNEVRCNHEPTLREKLFLKLLKLIPPPPSKIHTADRGKSKSAVPDNKGLLFPISDHYGVAARMVMQVPGRQYSSPGPITEEETLVITNVTRFLDDYAQKLRHQVTVTRYMALVSFAIVGVNLLVLRSAARSQEARTALTMEQVYALSLPSDNAQQPANGRSDNKEAAASQGNKSDLVEVSKRWGLKALNIVGLKPIGKESGAASSGRTASATQTAPNFTLLARELSCRQLWTDVSILSAVNVVCSIFGAASFVTGMLQRLGDAKILEEQIHMVREV